MKLLGVDVGGTFGNVDCAAARRLGGKAGALPVIDSSKSI
jgi:hypothetical protein